MRTCLLLSACAIALGTAWAGQADLARADRRPQVAARPAARFATGEETLPAAKPGLVSPPRTDYVTVQVGSTTYDYQANGSLSKMIAVSSDGVTHGSFMYSAATDQAWADRRVRAWCVNPDHSLVPALDIYSSRSGYTTAATTGPNPGNGLAPNSTVVAFHEGTNSWFGVDFQGCTHALNLLQGNNNCLWPHIALDGEDRVHLVNYAQSTSNSYYLASSDGNAWDAPSIMLTDNSNVLGSIPVGSKTSARAAVLFFQVTPAVDVPYDGGSNSIGSQIHNDLLGYVADDGDIYGQFAAGSPINFTSYGPESQAPFGPYGCRAYCDVDGLFDRTEAEELHMVFSGDPMWTDTLHVIWELATPDSLQETYFHWSLGRGQIWHLNTDSGEWGHVTGWNSKLAANEPWLDGGAWRMRQDRPSLAQDPETGYLYCAWSQRIEGDRAAPGAWGCNTAVTDSLGNAEILIACSADNGLTWGAPVNVTNTHTPGCTTDCMSEDWMSMAELAQDGVLRLVYVEDHSTGGVPQCEGQSVVNPIYYMEVPVADIPPHAGTPWDAEGRVGLAQTERWYGWYAAAWCGETAVMDSVKWVDPVHLLNESPFDVQLDHISWHHDPLDVLGPPENGGITEMGVEVQTPDGYVPVEAWNGVLPAWRGTKFNVHFAYAGLTLHDVLIGFHFADDRPSLYYRLEMVNALQEGETEPCTGVIPIPVEDVAQFEETLLQSFSGLDPAPRPTQFGLEQNWPNPFNPATTIRYSLATGSRVSLRVFNLAGQQVLSQDAGFQGAGWHQLRFDGASLASGTYIYTLEAGSQSLSRKMTLLK